MRDDVGWNKNAQIYIEEREWIRRPGTCCVAAIQHPFLTTAKVSDGKIWLSPNPLRALGQNELV